MYTDNHLPSIKQMRILLMRGIASELSWYEVLKVFSADGL